MSDPILKIAVVSDIQGFDSPHDWGFYNLKKAFRFLNSKKPDVLLNAGDICDHAAAKTFRRYQQIFKESFDREPIQIACAGNHDFWTDIRDPEKDWKTFCDALELPYDNPLCRTVGGYDFIAFSSVDGSRYPAESLAKLEAAIRRASERDPGKPIFVVTHENPSGTVAGSILEKGHTAFTELFSRWPQVISFGGHWHYPLEDERGIWQGAFTAIGTSTLSYGCMEEPRINAIGSILPFAREVNQMLYMEIFEDRLEIHRFHADGREIAPGALWRVPLPFRAENAPYTFEKRRNSRPVPAFKPGTEVLLRYDYGYLFLIFDQAQHPDFVHSYKIRVFRQDGSSVGEYMYVGDFYRLPEYRGSRMFCRLPDNTLNGGEVYRFEIYPVESFGKQGEPLVENIRINDNYHSRSTPFFYPQE